MRRISIHSYATIESLAKLSTVFKDEGIVTEGKTSGPNDTSSAVLKIEIYWAHKEGIEIYAGLLGMHTHDLTRNTRVSGLFMRFRNI